MPELQPVVEKPKLLKTDTRQWTSGRVKFAVIGWVGKPDRNYIVLEKNFFGKSRNPDQKFNLRESDWVNLKKLIDGDLIKATEWLPTVQIIDQKSLDEFLKQNPDALEKILASPDILKLNEQSIESLNKLVVKLFEIKKDQAEVILKQLTAASKQDLELFSKLLEDLRLNQISTLASLIYQKLKVIDLLETVCMDSSRSERDVHKIFESNTWLLGKQFEILQSDKPLSQYFETNVKEDPETRKRPDLILKQLPFSNDIVLVEFKAPGIKLKAKHIGQVLEYKALIQQNKPNVSNIHCFVYGYEKDHTFTKSNDVVLKTFSEIIAELRSEFNEYEKLLNESQQDIGILEQLDDSDIPF